MKRVVVRKENLMKENVIKRLENEMFQYKKELVSGAFTATQLVEEAYQTAMKQGISEAIQLLADERSITEEIWEWLGYREVLLPYLYQLWMQSDVNFVRELADVLLDEVFYDREVHTHE
jgi:hypothetical protein